MKNISICGRENSKGAHYLLLGAYDRIQSMGPSQGSMENYSPATMPKLTIQPIKLECISDWGVIIEKMSTYENIMVNIRELCGDPITNDYVNIMNQVSQPRFSAIKNTFKDPVCVFILACANNNILYKDMREMGIKLGIGSMETFSRRLYEMRRAGLIYTESIHNKRAGRPQIMLRFIPNAFKEMFNMDPSALLTGYITEHKA